MSNRTNSKSKQKSNIKCYSLQILPNTGLFPIARFPFANEYFHFDWLLYVIHKAHIVPRGSNTIILISLVDEKSFMRPSCEVSFSYFYLFSRSIIFKIFKCFKIIRGTKSFWTCGWLFLSCTKQVSAIFYGKLCLGTTSG